MSRERAAAVWRVYINSVEDKLAHVMEAQESLNGKTLDTAVIEVDPARIQQTGIGISVRPNMADVISISCSYENKVIWRHWGVVSEIEPHQSPDGPRLRITSRLEPWLWSVPLTGILLKNPETKQLSPRNGDLIFNPTIDGIDEGNCSPLDPTATEANYFIDPDSVRTPAALKLHGNREPVAWTLPKAVYYLCKTLNSDEFYVKNPDYRVLVETFSSDDSLLRNVVMPFGDYLSDCLDRLLIPLGYMWHISKDSQGLNVLRFVAKGTGGKAIQIKHQPIGSVYNNRSTEAENFTLRCNLSNLANHIWVYGSRQRVEFTAVCVRTWSEAEDDKTAEELYTGVDDFESVENVYRKWVIDTAGDYTEVRAGNKRFSLSDLFGNTNQVPGRRKLGPCLTVGADDAPVGQVQGVYVEYSNPLYPDVSGEPEWLPIGNWGCTLLEKEAGVYFRGDFVPEEILRQGADARIRITATLESDLQAFQDIPKRDSSPNGYDVFLPLNLENRFFEDSMKASGENKSRFFDDVYTNKTRTAKTNVDTSVMESFGKEIRNTFDAAEVSGPIVLEGCDYDYKVGDRVTGIPGLNIDLLQNPAGYPLQYPQIANITYEPQAQRTTLQLKRFRSDVEPPEARRRVSRRRKR